LLRVDGRPNAGKHPSYWTNDTSRDAQLVTQTLLDLEETLGRGGRREYVNADVRMRRSKATHTSHALLQSCRIPRQVQMDDDGCTLQVEPFAEHISRDQQVDALRGGDDMGVWRELREHFATTDPTSRDARTACGQLRNAAVAAEHSSQCVHCFGELAEGDDALAGVSHTNIMEEIGPCRIGI
jgi:hypothetical protein